MLWYLWFHHVRFLDTISCTLHHVRINVHSLSKFVHDSLVACPNAYMFSLDTLFLLNYYPLHESVSFYLPMKTHVTERHHTGYYIFWNHLDNHHYVMYEWWTTGQFHWDIMYVTPSEKYSKLFIHPCHAQIRLLCRQVLRTLDTTWYTNVTVRQVCEVLFPSFAGEAHITYARFMDILWLMILYKYKIRMMKYELQNSIK